MTELEEYLLINEHVHRMRHVRHDEEQWETLEPKYLLANPLEGLNIKDVRLGAEPGIHVLVGRNNSGKTRLLHAVQNARLGRTFVFDDLPPRMRQALEAFEIKDLPCFEVSWGRGISASRAAQAKEKRMLALPEIITLEPLGGSTLDKDVNPVLMTQLREELSRRLRFRPAVLVPTHRHVKDEGPLSDQGRLTELSSFTPMLENLRRDDATEEIFERIAEAFAQVTDGLSLEFRGTGGRSILHVREPGRRSNRLSECGDGLQDLMVILTYVAICSEYDLLLDEPGIRLHPHAQRKLLSHLESQSGRRAIWIASHDGVFVGAPGVGRRYYVQREPGQGVSKVQELPSRKELRDAFYDLGWAPQDALLADRVLYCEGPADRTIFEAVIRHLAETEADYGGTIVVELGGDGKVWGRKPQVLDSIDFLRRVAPHAEHVIVLDVGEHGSDVPGIKQWLEGRGASVVFLKRNELENYLLEPDLVGFLLEKAANEWEVSGDAMDPLPVLDFVKQRLGGYDLDRDKGSSILSDVFKEYFKKGYPKTDGAKWAVSSWYERAPVLSQELTQEIKLALGVRSRGTR